jgi:hypothetical protein
VNADNHSKHALRVFGRICLGVAVIIPLLVAILRDLQTAANVATLVSIPLTAAGLLGIYLPSKESGHQAPAPRTTGSKQAVVRYLGIGAGLFLGTFSVAIWLFLSSSFPFFPGDSAELVHQSLIVLDGPRPVPFEGGKTWRWLDLKSGTTTVTISPGGGSRNDGLRKIGWTIHATGSCDNYSNDNYIRWSFKADGQSLNMGYGAAVELPDHVDLLTLQMTVAVRDGCTIGLSWDDPSVLRSGSIPND